MKKIIDSFIFGAVMIVISAYLNKLVPGMGIIETVLVILAIGLLFIAMDNNGVDSLLAFGNTVSISIFVSLVFNKIYLTNIELSSYLVVVYILLFMQLVLFNNNIIDLFIKKISS